MINCVIVLQLARAKHKLFCQYRSRTSTYKYLCSTVLINLSHSNARIDRVRAGNDSMSERVDRALRSTYSSVEERVAKRHLLRILVGVVTEWVGATS